MRRSRTVAARDQLSPQELQIAQLAAEGLSNREIGQRLYLSHLYRLFPKLGIVGQLEAMHRREPTGAKHHLLYAQ
ncbi:MAG TPA: helix-turn-helix transcriptional regulator [Ktedonobacterales bacterium]|nr:helix-turn-helix transcriptional regulator [Ktedonobacterales bacterium]